MDTTNSNTAPKSLRDRWASPPRSGMQRIIWPFEYRHLRAFGRARIIAGIVLAGLGAVTLIGGSFTAMAVGFAALFLAAGAVSFSVGYWLLTIARSAPART
jgi:hypothetical protein